jgi:hypothetical protein
MEINNDIYYYKYLKYKRKYLELKQQEGGIAMPEILKSKARKEREALEKKLKERDIQMENFRNKLIMDYKNQSQYKGKLDIINNIKNKGILIYDKLSTLYNKGKTMTQINDSIKNIKDETKLVIELLKSLDPKIIVVNPNNYGYIDNNYINFVREITNVALTEENKINRQITEIIKDELKEEGKRINNYLGIIIK